MDKTAPQIDDLAARIERRREELGMDRNQLSLAIGMSKNGLTQFINASQGGINSKYLVALAHELKTTVGWLLGEDSDAATKAVEAAHGEARKATFASQAIQKLANLTFEVMSAQSPELTQTIADIVENQIVEHVPTLRSPARSSRSKSGDSRTPSNVRRGSPS